MLKITPILISSKFDVCNLKVPHQRGLMHFREYNIINPAYGGGLDRSRTANHNQKCLSTKVSYLLQNNITMMQ